MKVDTRDDKFYPKKGGFFDGDINYYFSKKSSLEYNNFTSFLIAKANMGATLPLDSKYTLVAITPFERCEKSNASVDSNNN